MVIFKKIWLKVTKKSSNHAGFLNCKKNVDNVDNVDYFMGHIKKKAWL